MPLTKKGEKIRRNMQAEYGSKKGESVFYASINKGKIKGAEKKKRELPKRGSGLLTPLGQRTLAGFMDKYGDAAGHTKFESAVERGVIDRAKMFKNPGPRHATGKFQSRPG